MDRSRLRVEVWSVIITAVVTALIWAWAAGETLEQESQTARLQFTAPQADTWLIKPSTDRVRLTLEGSKSALQQIATAADAAPIGVRLGSEHLPAEPGTHMLAVAAALQDGAAFENVGVRIVECEPATIQVEVDELIQVQAEVRPVLPGVQHEGEITVDPPTATITIPSRLRDQLPNTLYANAEAEQWQLASLEPDVQHTLVVNVRPQDALANNPDVRVTPATAAVSFSIRSQIRELLLDSVRVQISGTPQNIDEYKVELEPRQLRDITIRADAELIRRIEQENIPVIGFVHLTSLELEQHIEQKAVTYFLAMIPNSSGGAATGVAIEARSESGDDPPIVQLTITERPAP